jgi:hypothetical protein
MGPEPAKPTPPPPKSEFNTRTLDDQRPEQGAVYQLLRLVYSLFWELHVDPGKGRGMRFPYGSDFPGRLVDSATRIDDLLKKRVAAVVSRSTDVVSVVTATMVRGRLETRTGATPKAAAEAWRLAVPIRRG